MGTGVLDLHSLEEKRVDGIVVCSSRVEDAELSEALAQHHAAVLVNRRLEDSQVGMVEVMLSSVSPGNLMLVKVLGIAQVDLFIPILTHVFGEAQLGGTSSIISTYRLKEGLSPLGSESSLASRILKEAIHELGHTFKLRHCREKTCIMHYCRSVTDVDHKSKQLCRYCSILIEDEKKRLAR